MELGYAQKNPLQMKAVDVSVRLKDRSFSFGSSTHEKVPQGAEDDTWSAHSDSIHAGIDLEHIHRSLDHVNNFSKRRQNDKLHPVLMYEIKSTGESCYKNISLRELLNDVNYEAAAIDLANAKAQEAADPFGLFQEPSPPTNSAPMGRAHNSLDDLTLLASASGVPNRVLHRHLNVMEETTGRRRGLSSAPQRQGLHGTRSLYETRSGIHHHPATAPSAGRVSPSVNDYTYEATGALRLRDLRRLDFKFNPNEERSVLIRRHAVLFAMDPIRAVVTANRVIIIVPNGADSLLALLDQYMQEWVAANNGGTNTDTPPPEDSTPVSPPSPTPSPETSCASTPNPRSSGTAMNLAPGLQVVGEMLRRMTVVAGMDSAPLQPTHTVPHVHRQLNTHDLPFEMHAFEALLTTVMALETQEFNRLNSQVQIILNFFRSGSLLPIEVQEKMRNRKNDLSVMVQRISSARAAIHELTEDDEDMALMNLSVLHAKPVLYRYPLVPEILSKHDEMEELLESYLIDFNALESKIELTRSQIQNAEELLSLRLDTSRNELLITNTILAVLACCFGLGAYVTGIFGMNLDNTGKLQSTPHVFHIVIITSFFGMFGLFVGLVTFFRRTGVFPSKITLHSHDAAKLQYA